ncbi:MAG: helix-turn-helix transcriptional regulator [Daejeonella sp.]
MSQKDIGNITLAAKILGQYKGFSFFEDLTSVLEKVETRVQVRLSENLQKIVQFEHIPESIGIEYIRTLMDMITSGQVVELTYKRFNSKETKKHILHPYLLKEYRNRWYVLGLNHKHSKITTYALDRISHIEEMSDMDYIKNTSFNPDTYFKDTIGVTYSGEDPVEVILQVINDFVPYLLTQPLHESQQTISQNAEGLTIKLILVINEELQTLLMGYADLITILSPESLKKIIQQKLLKSQKNLLHTERK